MTPRSTSSDLTKCKLPPFTPDSPHTWIQICESIFVIYKVNRQEERFALTLTSLPAEELSRFQHICELEAEEEQIRYDLLKKAIVTHFDPPLHKKFQMVWEIPTLQPGQRPSDVLQQIFRWLPPGENREHFLVRQFFFSRLPTNMQNLCRNFNEKSLQEIATIADGFSSSLPRSSVFSLTQHDDEAPRINAARGRAGPCRIHAKYGRKARNCAEPTTCTFNQGNS
jgi:hypothetical protein